MRRSILRFVTLLSLVVILGCASPSSKSSPDKMAPTITLHEPATGDTIATGKNQITYKADDDHGLAFLELYVDDKLVSKHKTDASGAMPVIQWEIDTSLVNSSVSYFVIAYDRAGYSTQSNRMTDIQIKRPYDPPAAPVNLILTKLSDVLLNLLWEDKSGNEVGFELWRKERDGAYEKIKTLPANTISANDTIAVPAAVYYYQIKAFNHSAISASNEVNSGAGFGNTPVIPTAVRALALGTTRIKVTWANNSLNELAFKIQRRSASETGFSQIACVPPNTVEYIDKTDLVATTTYVYRVAAQGPYGQSEWSDTAAGTTLAQDLIPPPNLSAIFRQTEKQVLLSWINNGLAETRIERKIGSNGNYTEIGKTAIEASSYIDAAVELGNEYFYRVALIAGGQLTNYSNEVLVSISR